MLAAAARRTAGLTNVTLLTGEATDLPVPAESFDAAISVQVLEYVTNIRAALAEMYRVLRPGGRLVVWDVDWSTVSWFSADAARMGEVLRAWDEHLAHPTLPQWLASEMMNAGFVNNQVEGHAFVNTDAGPDAYSGTVIPLMEDFVAGHGVPAQEAAEWREELEALSDASRYFFSVTQFCFSATKPD
jgi:SAM-dependent methyltransferase